MKLNDGIHDQIKELCANGDKLFERSKFEEAVHEYGKALELVPDPKSDWEASVWIYTAIGDACFYKKDYQKAADALYEACNGPGAVNNAFVNLRLGQCLFELKEMEKAEDYLLRAYMLDGLDIFRSENKKYISYMRKKFNLD